MGKLTVTTNAKVKPEELPSVESPVSTGPLPPKPGAPLTHFVVPQPSAPPVYRPPRRTNRGCSKKCKTAVLAAVVVVLMVSLIVTGVYFLKMHRRAEKPPCFRTGRGRHDSGERHDSHERDDSRENEEDEDCDEEKNDRWYDWLQNCMNQWFNQHEEGRDDGDGPPRPPGSEEGEPPRQRAIP
ncbi:hypothetical protein Bbelb_091220 [Branchiostoma belcheri]|nr:hypothetical protein Bbelb_091220 [Branchiostoma belcheri]